MAALGATKGMASHYGRDMSVSACPNEHPKQIWGRRRLGIIKVSVAAAEAAAIAHLRALSQSESATSDNAKTKRRLQFLPSASVLTRPSLPLADCLSREDAVLLLLLLLHCLGVGGERDARCARSA